MSALQTIEWSTDDGQDLARAPSGHALHSVRRIDIRGEARVRTGQGEEACAIVLDGTFDLQAGGTRWQSRGARVDPRQGRPVAVYVPPDAEFQASGGDGSALWFSAMQPKAPPAEGLLALRQTPLLPLAGSGKAFDPASGGWLPQESFPNAAESLPPRRIDRHLLVRHQRDRVALLHVLADQRRQAGHALDVERVFAAEYKAATLCVDECTIAAHSEFRWGDLPRPPAARHALLYVACEAPVVIRAMGLTVTVQGRAAVSCEGDLADLTFATAAESAYVAIAFGPK